MRQTACLVVNPLTVDSYALRFNYSAAVRASDSMTVFSDAMSLFWPAWFNYWFYLTLAGSVCRISQEYSSLFHHGDLFDFCVFTMMHR